MKSESLADHKHELEHGHVLAPRFNADGLVTAVVQEVGSGEILMLAHVNQEALTRTIESGKAHFWSRSRQQLWMKGETSGNTLEIEELLIDCDQDAIIMKVTLNGSGACHTGAHSCFYRKIEDGDGKPRLVAVT